MSTRMTPPPLPSAEAVVALLDAMREPWSRLMRAATDPERPVPGLDWTVGELAAHMVTTAETFIAMLRGEGSPYPSLEPGAVAAVNRGAMASVADRHGAALVERLTAGFVALSSELLQPGAPDTVPWHGGLDMPRVCVGAGMLGDYAIHGRDMARALGRRWVIDPDVTRVLLPIAPLALPLMVDAEAAAGFRATYRLRLRGQGDYYLVFDDGDLQVGISPPGRVDCKIDIDPVTYLLAAYGRVGQLRPSLTGKAFAHGRKPWLAFKFNSLIVLP